MDCLLWEYYILMTCHLKVPNRLVLTRVALFSTLMCALLGEGAKVGPKGM